MKTFTATFAISDTADAAVDALNDAGVIDVDVVELENGDTVLSGSVADGMVDAATAILETADSANFEDLDDMAQPSIEGHPDGSGPVVMPLVPGR